MKAIIMVDGGYLLACLRSRFHLGAEGAEFANRLHRWFLERLMPKAKKASKINLELFRIHYYDCYSFRDSIFNPFNGTVSAAAESNKRDAFLNAIGRLPQVYIKLGETQINGWKPARSLLPSDMGETITPEFMRPNFEQKQVDTQIAIDTCRIIHLRQAEALIFIADDCDFIPVFDEARRNGVLVLLCNMRARKSAISKLSHSADFVLHFENPDFPFFHPLKGGKPKEDEGQDPLLDSLAPLQTALDSALPTYEALLNGEAVQTG